MEQNPPSSPPPAPPEVRDTSYNQAFFAFRKADFKKVTVTLAEKGLHNFEEFVDRYRKTTRVTIVETTKFGPLGVYRFDEIGERWPRFVIMKANRLNLPEDCDDYRVLERIDGSTFMMEYQIIDDCPHRVLSPEDEMLLVKGVIAEFLVQPVVKAYEGLTIRSARRKKLN